MDEGDKATAENEVHMHMALKQLRKGANSTCSSTVCIDCGQPIPAGRLKAMAANAMNCARCIGCQSDYERRHGGFA